MAISEGENVVSWKLKLHTPPEDLHPCLKERHKRLDSFLDKALSQEESSCNGVKGASAIGMVLFVFYSTLFVLLPVHLAIQEHNVYKTINNNVKVATEMACYTLVRHISTSGFSEGMILEDPFQRAIFNSEMSASMFEDIEISNLSVELKLDNTFPTIQVYFTYPYRTKFILKSLITKIVIVKLAYELPIDY